jgi:precorrin-6A/cobalt-precorrin-6A reductase
MSSLAVMTASPTRLRVLILGGTADANQLAAAVADAAGIDAVLSYAGRTDNPTPPPKRSAPHRAGCFSASAGCI